MARSRNLRHLLWKCVRGGCRAARFPSNAAKLMTVLFILGYAMKVLLIIHLISISQLQSADSGPPRVSVACVEYLSWRVGCETYENRGLKHVPRARSRQHSNCARGVHRPNRGRLRTGSGPRRTHLKNFEREGRCSLKQPKKCSRTEQNQKAPQRPRIHQGMQNPRPSLTTHKLSALSFF